MISEIDQNILDELTKTIYLILKGKTPECIKLPDDYPENELRQFTDYFNKLIVELNSTTDFTLSLSKGELFNKPLQNKMILNSAILNLQMDLRHLTFKTKQIAAGDFTQRVNFLGEFSDAFNSMTHQLKISFEEIQNQKNELNKINEILEFERNNLENIVYQRTIELQEAIERKEVFLRNISHELRTPLNGIMGYTDMLLLVFNKNLDEKQIEYLQTIKNSSCHLLNLVDDILNLTSYQSTVEKQKQEVLDIQFEISQVKKSLITQLSNKSLDLIVSCDDSVKSIIYNKEAFKQILINLISNAIKFSPANVEIIIKVEKVDDISGKISVIDCGPGIPDEEKSKIFEEFYKSKLSVSEAIGGIGVGLSICKKLIELHGGVINVESNAPSGSIFWFTYLLNPLIEQT